MKKKCFAFILIGIIILMILTFTLQTLFSEQTASFGLSCGIFFLSIFCLFSYKNALKPTDIFGPIDTTKKYYEKKEALPQYQNLCKILFVITISAGTLTMLGGFGEIIINYLRSLLTR